MSNATNKRKSNNRGKNLTLMQQKAFKYMLENGGSVADSMRHAGYANSMVKNPQKLTKSHGFAAELEKVGLSDKVIAKKYVSLMGATNIDKESFEGIKRRGKWTYPDDQVIIETIEGTEEKPTGCTVMFVQIDTTTHRKIVTYRRPDNAVQKGIVELTGKVKSHFAPEKLDVVSHELDETERKFLQGLMDK